MLSWLTEHGTGLSALANIGMLFLWFAYMQLFLMSYRAQRQPKILINRGVGRGLDARFLISNMSAESIYVETIIATLVDGDDRLVSTVTEPEGTNGEESEPLRQTRQGPLPSGGFMDCGSFRDVVARILRRNGRADDADPNAFSDQARLELQVVANYGSERLLVAAKRHFAVEQHDEDIALKPFNLDTEQLRTRSERRKLAEALDDYA